MEKIGIVGCSNGRKKKYEKKLKKLEKTLLQIGLCPVYSDFLFEKENIFSGSAQERAQALMDLYNNDEITHIFDISGGDVSNGILPYLDFDIIKNSSKIYWGYSDLTVLINAIYTKTNKSSNLYQIRNIVENKNQLMRFENTMIHNQKDLFDVQVEFIQKEKMEGIIIGGNIRCLLKLAGTEYWPDFNNKILVLESLSGGVAKMETCLCQLQQMGVFDKINGLLLGTFSEMEEEKCEPTIVELVKRHVSSELPIAITKEIGHGVDAKAIVIGKKMEFIKGE